MRNVSCLTSVLLQPDLLAACEEMLPGSFFDFGHLFRFEFVSDFGFRISGSAGLCPFVPLWFKPGSARIKV
jgi:hypothetical protein